LEGKDLRKAGLKVTLPRLKILEILEGSTTRHLYQGTHHDHIVCLDCGRVEEFMDSGIEERQTAVAQKLGFSIRDHSLILYGHCRRENCPFRTRKPR